MLFKNTLWGFVCLILVCYSCHPSTQKQNTTLLSDSLSAPPNDSTVVTNEEDEFNETATFYIVVNDTGMDYYQLRKQLFDIHEKNNQEIDTLGRYYNPIKKLIVLPDTDDDEEYRGDYYPRRFPSTSLSLEYLVLYTPNAQENTIALVSGIYENKQQADSALNAFIPYQPKTFVVKANMYTGCLH